MKRRSPTRLPEFLLVGAAAAGVALGTPVKDENDDNLWYYPFTGEFGTGPVEVQLADGAFSDTKGNTSAAATQSFVVAGPEADLLSPLAGASIDVIELNQQGYLEIRFTPSGTAAIDPASLTDAAPEFVLSGTAAAGVSVHGVAEPVEGQENVYRYQFDGAFIAGEVNVEFARRSVEPMRTAWPRRRRRRALPCWACRPPWSGSTSPKPTGLTLLNQRGYLDVQFTPTAGATLVESSILDANPEFQLEATPRRT